jgi:hypothetical protein
MRWPVADIADAVAQGLEQLARAEDTEQAVYGFDHHDELGLHPFLQRSLQDAGYGVWPEERYPSDRQSRKRSKGKRCDIVLTDAPQALPLRDEQLKGTLFDQQPAVDLEDAYWLEVKTVAQFEIGGPARHYSKELLSPVVSDIKKLWTDGIIRYAGLLLVLFAQDQFVADHDIAAWHRKCMDRGFPVAPPALRGFRVTDRIGNGYCAVALFSVRGV